VSQPTAPPHAPVLKRKQYINGEQEYRLNSGASIYEPAAGSINNICAFWFIKDRDFIDHRGNNWVLKTGLFR